MPCPLVRCAVCLQPFGPNPRVIAASFISFVGAALANAGGVGGGGLFVPMFNLFLGYDAKTSTALSKCELASLYSLNA